MNVSIPLAQEIVEQSPWLFQELGFHIVEDQFNPESFGDSLVVLESPRLLVRFIRDRGQVFAEVASSSDPESWWYLEHVCELITGKKYDPGFELPMAAGLLRENFPALVDYLGPKYEDTIHALKQRMEGS